MASVVTLQEAKDHLRITTSAGDPGEADLQAKLDAAEAVIADYLQVPTLDPTKLHVKQAVLLELGELYRFRGDDVETLPRAPADGYLLPAITSLLHREVKFPL
jgi:hypothetical protein